jgi:hypothetical protein
MAKEANLTEEEKKLLHLKSPVAEEEKKVESIGLAMVDDDRKRAMGALVEAAFNFPRDKLLSWTRWLPREIPLLASTLTKMCALDPGLRPKNPDGSPKRLALIYIEFLGLLRLAEKGALRGEAKDFLQAQAEKETGGEGWGKDMR